MENTEEQRAIIDCMALRDGPSIVADAGAGCGKSTTIELGARGVKHPGLAVAFGKRDADRMASKFPHNFIAKSFNSLGFGALRGMVRTSCKAPDDKKLGKIITEIVKGEKLEISQDQWGQVLEVARVGMGQGIIVGDSDAERGLTPDTEEVWEDIAEGRVERDSIGMVVAIARRALQRNVELIDDGVVSFDDQVYYPTLFGGKFPTFQTIVMDEYQDLSPLNIAMVARCMRGDARLIAVGDYRQAIYAWRGACGDAGGQIRSLGRMREFVGLPLMTTFRCPRKVVERQQGHVPGFRAWNGAVDGKVVVVKEWDWEDVKAEANEGDTVAVLCRNNGPLLSLAFKLLREGVGVKMLGRDIGKGLVVLSRKIAKEDETPADAVRAGVDIWEGNEKLVLEGNGKVEKVDAVEDRAECLRAILDGGARTAGDLRSMLTRLFAREDGMVTLSSIHKSKGAEWDVVVILDPWRIPGKWAKKAAMAGDAVPLQQEYNARYVAETRAKRVLVLANFEEYGAGVV